MKKEKLSEKRYQLIGFGLDGNIWRYDEEDVNKCFKEILKEINDKIEKKIKVEKKSNYTKDDVFVYGYVSGLEDIDKLFKRIIKKRTGEELNEWRSQEFDEQLEKENWEEKARRGNNQQEIGEELLKWKRN